MNSVFLVKRHRVPERRSDSGKVATTAFMVIGSWILGEASCAACSLHVHVAGELGF